uniref:Uncharacterized protein n=1 Tax=Tetranychus urticae TaxID=32264 RepID=T1KQ65_TETUR
MDEISHFTDTFEQSISLETESSSDVDLDVDPPWTLGDSAVEDDETVIYRLACH